MKTIKFAPHLVNKILSGEKTVTWRLFDDKDLAEGDELIFKNSETLEEFARAKVTNAYEKPLSDITEEDYAAGHERYDSHEKMIETFRGYYGDSVNGDTKVKILAFELI